MKKEVKLSRYNFERLSEFPEVMKRVTFESKQGYYINQSDKVKLREIYTDITGDSYSCMGCSNDWAKRLSHWYKQSKYYNDEKGKL